jgi:hypothetical protein
VVPYVPSSVGAASPVFNSFASKLSLWVIDRFFFAK